ncbi:MAG: glycosyltransferase, partial [Cytophagales bacterium]
KLNVHYHLKGNDGQGFSRNYGMKFAKGDYFVILDSDVLLDQDFLEKIHQHLQNEWLDCYGGPDRLHPKATDIQKAVDFCMTSLLTTGGIRGGKKRVGKFYPRSFNMGFSREVYEKTNGYKLPFFGEDMEFSSRVMALGFKTGLIPDAHVYHKRKEKLSLFFKQMHFFGRARINTFLLFPDSLKLTHFFPLAFCIGFLISFLFLLAGFPFLMLIFSIYFILLFLSAFLTHKNLKVSLLVLFAIFFQMTGYALGFCQEFWKRMVLKKNPYIQNQ